jgi:hypothetical protein
MQSASVAKDVVRKEIGGCVQRLLERQDELLAEIEAANERLSEQVTQEAQHHLDDAIRCQQVHKSLLKQAKVSDDEIKEFRRSQTMVQKHVMEAEKSAPAIEVSFSHSTNLEDITQFGCLSTSGMNQVNITFFVLMLT